MSWGVCEGVVGCLGVFLDYFVCFFLSVCVFGFIVYEGEAIFEYFSRSIVRFGGLLCVECG